MYGCPCCSPGSDTYVSPSLSHLTPHTISTLDHYGQGGDGLANLVLDCISANQSDFNGVIHSNFIHSFAVVLKYCVGVLNRCKVDS